MHVSFFFVQLINSSVRLSDRSSARLSESASGTCQLLYCRKTVTKLITDACVSSST